VALGSPDHTVGGHPGHELGVDEVTGVAADLPDPAVGLAPSPLHDGKKGTLKGPCVGVGRVPAVTSLFQRHDDLSIDVELRLAGRGVADPDRSRAAEAVQPAELALGEKALAPDPVHDLDLVGIPIGGTQQPRAPRCPFGHLARMLERP